MYPASFIVIIAVAFMVLLWGAFLVWGWRSGQLRDLQELGRLPLEEESSSDQENHG